MRLAHPRFAYLDILIKTLFGAIQLVATPRRVERLEHADISPIACFVRKVTFVTPPHSWTMNYEEFREVITAQEIQGYGFDHQSWSVSRSFDRRNTTEQDWSGDLTLSENQIESAFEGYRSDALAAETLLLGETLKATWTKVLGALSQSLVLRFISNENNRYGTSHLPAQPDCVIRPHQHDEVHQSETCDRIAAPVGDALFAAGIACLAETNLEINTFEVACIMTGRFGWEILPGWGSLDLSQTKRFIFEPCHDWIYHDYPNLADGADAIADRAADAIDAVMKKCNINLEEFTYNSCPKQWPDPTVVPLPKLKKLTINGGNIRGENLRLWMAEMRSLEYFDASFTDSDPPGWSKVFQGIRDHSQGMEIHFNPIFIGDGEIRLHYHTRNFQKFLEKEEDTGQPWSEDDSTLPLYLSGKIEFNAETRRYLQGE